MTQAAECLNGVIFTENILKLQKEQAAAKQARTHNTYLGERRARPSSRPHRSAAKLKSDSAPAPPTEGPAAAGPAMGAPAPRPREHLNIERQGASGLPSLTSAEALGMCNYVELIDPTFRGAGGVD